MTESATILAELRQLRDDVQSLRRRHEQPPPITVGSIEAARLLSVSRKTLGEWARHGKIPRIKEDGVFLYRVADLEAFAAERAKVIG